MKSYWQNQKSYWNTLWRTPDPYKTREKWQWSAAHLVLNSQQLQVFSKETSKIHVSSDVDFHEQKIDRKQIKANVERYILDFGLEEEPNSRAPEDVINHQKIVDAAVSNNKEKLRVGKPIAYIIETLPIIYIEAVSSTDAENWPAAMEELSKLCKETKLELPCLCQRWTRSKWVFAIAKSFSQRESIEYFETSAPVVR